MVKTEKDKIIEKPRFYYIDLNNYTDNFLAEIILWQKQKIEKLQIEVEKEKQGRFKALKSKIDTQDRYRKKFANFKENKLKEQK